MRDELRTYKRMETVAGRETSTATNGIAEESQQGEVSDHFQWCDQTNPEVFSIELFHEMLCDPNRTFISLENRLYRGVLVYSKPERIRGVFRLLDLHVRCIHRNVFFL